MAGRGLMPLWCAAAGWVIAAGSFGPGCQPQSPDPESGSAVAAGERTSEVSAATATGPILNVTDSVLAMQVVVARAVSAARNASIDTLAPAAEGSTTATDPGLTTVELVFVSNAHGELEDCGCPRHPLGGLARRATIWDGIDAAPGAALHFDAGNALFRDMPRSDAAPPSDDHMERAAVIAQSLSAMGAQFLAVGPRDLTAGATALRRMSERARLRLLATNLQLDGAPLGERSVVAETDGVRVGFVSVLRSDAQDAGFWEQTGVSAVSDVESLTAAIQELRASTVKLVVLVDTAGGEGLERLITDLRAAGAAPDLVVMSGNGMSTHEPRVVAGVPALESGNRGKQVAHVTLGLAEGVPVSFATGARAYELALESVQNTSRVLGQSEERLARTRARGGNDPVAENVLLALRQQRAELPRLYAMLLEQRNNTDEGAAATASQLAVELVNVELEIEERADIRDMVAAVSGE